MANEIVIALISSGLGASVGSIGAAVVNSRTQRGESRANAADLVTEASERMLARYEKQNENMRKALVLITDVLDELIDELDAKPALQKKARAANKAARLAIT